MCKSKRDALAADPQPRSTLRSTGTNPSSTAATSLSTDSGNRATTATASSASASSTTSRSSLASLRNSLPERPAIYPFAEIRSATNNFLAKRLSSSASASSSWRCTLRGRDVVVFQRSFRGGDPSAVPARLSALCRSHHSSIIRLLGASLAGGNIYLAYEYVPGASLADCLRNPRNPSFTPLASWLSRVQVAADLAQGLEYIHTQSATVHNRIKSTGVIITDPHLRAKICHFGAADLAGELPAPADLEVRESGRTRMRIEGRAGYIAPEVLDGRDVSQRSDVYAFGVVVLELLSGEEPVRFRFDRERGEYERSSVMEEARGVIGGDEGGEEEEGRLRRWVDRRLRDSFPVVTAERLIRVALRCVEAEPVRRPDMTWVAGRVSKLLLDSQAWGERVQAPTGISVSLAPR